MARLVVHVEGQTEEQFVNEVLRGHLIAQGYWDVYPRIVGNARQRGGIVAWPSARREIVRRMKADPNCIVTTMVDYYGLPRDNDRAWPSRAEAARLMSGDKAQYVEQAIREDLATELDDTRSFVPFVVMHEFEGLLFSDCRAFASAIGRKDLESGFQAVRDQFATPEEINDSPDTAPSKRVLSLFPTYQKPLFGNLAILEIGLERIRAECPHFDGWLRRIEDLAPR